MLDFKNMIHEDVEFVSTKVMKLLVSTDYSLITMKACIFLLLRSKRPSTDEVFLNFFISGHILQWNACYHPNMWISSSMSYEQRP
jgi:hypothetical protein